METSSLFSPVTVGRAKLSHRVVMAPMTRRRASDDHVPSPVMAEYYSQRAVVPGTLIISEATSVSPRSAALPNTPGIWSREQVEAWKPITAAVHARGSFIYVQLWMCGRAARPGAVRRGAGVVSSGDVPVGPGSPAPRPMTEDEIQESITEFAQASRNAIEAGFDGVELHGANGYLLDQFTQDVSNNRHDRWGGSVENRSRFPLAVAKAVAEAIGADRVGYRVSPWSKHHGMGMRDPVAQFTDLVAGLRDLKLSYLHVVESRVSGNSDAPGRESVDFLAELWGDTSPVIFAGGYNAVTARGRVDEEQARGRRALVAFGRVFVSNPDLPTRIRDMLPVTRYERDLFYEVGSEKGYIDYPLWDEQKKTEGLDTKHVWPTGQTAAA
ncbi:NADPH dehydrogenase [Coniochaeta sp. PMI_546]|nr:NADPH dehydrogenase [Coniochaeta sp. PMI_546]